jgi:hypothetical protein
MFGYNIKLKKKNDKIGNSPNELNVPRQGNVAEEITTRTHTNRRIKAHAAFCHSKTEAVCSSLPWALAFLSFFAYSNVSQTSLLADPFWLLKITNDPYVLTEVNIDCPDDTYPKPKIFISERLVGSWEYIPVAYVIMHCINLP